jgi:hypothetical protein
MNYVSVCIARETIPGPDSKRRTLRSSVNRRALNGFAYIPELYLCTSDFPRNLVNSGQGEANWRIVIPLEQLPNHSLDAFDQGVGPQRLLYNPMAGELHHRTNLKR